VAKRSLTLLCDEPQETLFPPLLSAPESENRKNYNRKSSTYIPVLDSLIPGMGWARECPGMCLKGKEFGAVMDQKLTNN